MKKASPQKVASITKQKQAFASTVVQQLWHQIAAFHDEADLPSDLIGDIHLGAAFLYSTNRLFCGLDMEQMVRDTFLDSIVPKLDPKTLPNSNQLSDLLRGAYQDFRSELFAMSPPLDSKGLATDDVKLFCHQVFSAAFPEAEYDAFTELSLFTALTEFFAFTYETFGTSGLQSTRPTPLSSSASPDEASKNNRKARWKILAIIFAALFVIAVCWAVYATYLIGVEHYEMQEKLDEQTALADQYHDKSQEYKDLYQDALSERNVLQRENSELKGNLANYERSQDFIDAFANEWAFWRSNAVIVTTTGGKYHTYGCQHIEDSPFYIFNSATAKVKGYTPCLDCNPPE